MAIIHPASEARNVSVESKSNSVYSQESHQVSAIAFSSIRMSMKGMNAVTPSSSRKLPITIMIIRKKKFRFSLAVNMNPSFFIICLSFLYSI